jgi:hypothetical protein
MAIRESFSFEGHGVKPDRFRKHKSYQGLPLAITSALVSIARLYGALQTKLRGFSDFPDAITSRDKSNEIS